VSLLGFKTVQYNGKRYAAADDAQLAGITEVPKRELMRRGVNQHTLEKICRRERVRAGKLAKCLVLDEHEQTKNQ